VPVEALVNVAVVPETVKLKLTNGCGGSVGFGVGFGVGAGVGTGVGWAVGRGVGFGVGAAATAAVGLGLGLGLADGLSLGSGVADGVEVPLLCATAACCADSDGVGALLGPGRDWSATKANAIAATIRIVITDPKAANRTGQLADRFR
jgi:hypothetical protein